MPAPRPSITAITVANDGRASGLASAASRICPTTTPISAPASVTAIDAERAEQQRQQDDRDPHADQLADRRGLLGGEVDQDPALGDGHAAALAALGRLHERIAVRLLEVLRLGAVADRDRRQAPVARQRPALGERVLDDLDALEVADLVERSGDRGARRGIGDLALLDGEDQRRVGAREGRAVLLEEVERLLGLRARDVEVVRRLATCAGGDAEQHDDGDGAGEPALPMVGQGAGEPREQQGHLDLPSQNR